MSFRCSISDVALLTRTSYNLVQNTRRAGGEHEEVSIEVRSLNVVLQRLEQEISSSDSVLHKSENSSREDIEQILSGCKTQLSLLEDIITKYQILSQKERSTRKLWKGMRFGSGEIARVKDIQVKLAFYASALTLYLNLASAASIGRVEKQMEDTSEKLRDVKKAIHVITAKVVMSSHSEGSVLSNYPQDDKAIWKEFRRSLISRGFKSSFVNRNQSIILAYFEELGARGIMDTDLDAPTEVKNSFTRPEDDPAPANDLNAESFEPDRPENSNQTDTTTDNTSEEAVTQLVSEEPRLQTSHQPTHTYVAPTCESADDENEESRYSQAGTAIIGPLQDSSPDLSPNMPLENDGSLRDGLTEVTCTIDQESKPVIEAVPNDDQRAFAHQSTRDFVKRPSDGNVEEWKSSGATNDSIDQPLMKIRPHPKDQKPCFFPSCPSSLDSFKDLHRHVHGLHVGVKPSTSLGSQLLNTYHDNTFFLGGQLRADLEALLRWHDRRSELTEIECYGNNHGSPTAHNQSYANRIQISWILAMIDYDVGRAEISLGPKVVTSALVCLNKASVPVWRPVVPGIIDRASLLEELKSMPGISRLPDPDGIAPSPDLSLVRKGRPQSDEDLCWRVWREEIF